MKRCRKGLKMKEGIKCGLTIEGGGKRRIKDEGVRKGDRMKNGQEGH